MSAYQGLQIQGNTTKLFSQGAYACGVLSTPHNITQEHADRVGKNWEANFSGPQNVGRVAVLGNDMKYTPIMMTAVDAQLIEQLKWTDEKIAETFHYPGCLLGIAPWPPYTDIQSVMLQYYVQALQNPINNLQILLRKGLELPSKYRILFDLSALLEMDSKTQTEVLKERVSAGLISINEARAELDYRAVKGGESPMAQQQMFAIAALAERDRNQPFAKPASPPAATPAMPADAALKTLDADEIRRKALALLAA